MQVINGNGDPALNAGVRGVPVGFVYKENGCSREWYKYGPNDYNWRLLACDPADGYIFVLGAESDSSNIAQTNTTGTGTANLNTGQAGRPGLCTMGVTSTATPDRVRQFHGGGGNPPQGYVLGGGKVMMSAWLNIPTLSDGVDNFSHRTLGGDSLTNAAHTNGAWVETDLQANATNNWVAHTVNGGAGLQTLDLGVAPVAGVWTEVGGIINALGTSVDFLVDKTKRGTIAASLPIAPNGFAMVDILVKTLGLLGARTVLVDAVYFAMAFTTPR